MTLVLDYKIDIDEMFQDSMHYQTHITDEGISKVNDCYEDVYNYELHQFIENKENDGTIKLYKNEYWKMMGVNDDE